MHSSWRAGAAATGPLPSQVLSRPSCPSSRFAVRELGRQVSLQLMAIGGRSGREVDDQLTSLWPRSLEITEGAGELVLVGSRNRRQPASASSKEWTMDSGRWRGQRDGYGSSYVMASHQRPGVHRSGPRLLVRAVGMCRKSALSGSSSTKDGPSRCPIDKTWVGGRRGGGEEGELPGIQDKLH